jgi:hypothetical protein
MIEPIATFTPPGATPAVPSTPAPARVAIRRYTPLSADQQKNPYNLLNARVQYCHFDTSRKPFLGKVVDVNVVKGQVLVEPAPDQPARFPRWRSLFDVLAVVTTEHAIVPETLD